MILISRLKVSIVRSSFGLLVPFERDPLAVSAALFGSISPISVVLGLFPIEALVEEEVVRSLSA